MCDLYDCVGKDVLALLKTGLGIEVEVEARWLEAGVVRASLDYGHQRDKRTTKNDNSVLGTIGPSLTAWRQNHQEDKGPFTTLRTTRLCLVLD